jgi:hypothetical protein
MAPTVPPAVRLAPRRPIARRAGLALALVLVGVPLRPSHAGDPPDRVSTREASLTAERRAAVRRACDWLVTKQQPSGAYDVNKAPVALTALATLALMTGGSGIDRGPHGEAVRKGVDWMVRLVEKPRKDVVPGYLWLSGDLDSRMHGHGYAMLALASALASADGDMAKRLRRALKLAVECAEASQTPTGGWGYNATPSQDHEGSVTVTVAQGLRAAHDAGLRVSSEIVANGLRYLRQSQKPDGSFKYSIQQDRSTYALTAAAVSSFMLLGRYAKDTRDGDDARIRDGVRFLKRSVHDVLVRPEWAFYGHFYAAWAAWQQDGDDPSDEGASRGRIDPDSKRFWGPWHTLVYRTLLDQQRIDGSWHDEDERFAFPDELPTSFAILTLSIPDEPLPIFQR